MLRLTGDLDPTEIIIQALDAAGTVFSNPAAEQVRNGTLLLDQIAATELIIEAVFLGDIKVPARVR